VLEARDGQEALEVFENNKNTVDLVILDMRMPFNGGRAFDQLKQIKSDVKVLIASGYTEDQQIREMFKQGCIGFIQKPFSVNLLSKKVLKALQY
jgi:two-component system cell cycle sensor histidine kinase/response regulator CckA